MQTRGTFAIGQDNVDKQVYTIINAARKEKKSQWRKYFNVEASVKAFERRVSVTPFGAVPEVGEGDDYILDIIRPGHTKDLYAKEFKLGFLATKTAMEDDQTGTLKKYATFLAHSGRVTYAVGAADILLDGFTTELTGDGKPIFATDHILKGGGTARNELSTPADLSQVSLEEAFTDLANETKDEAGHLMEPMDGYYLVVSPINRFNAARIVKSALQSNTAENALNTIKSELDIEVIVDPYLSSSPQAWYLIPKMKAANGLISFTRIPMGMEPPEVRSGNRLYAIRGRQVWGCEYWQGLFGSPGA